MATAYVDAVIKNRDKKLSTAWKKGFDSVIDTYLGKLPETFTYQGKQYTPKSFGESLGLNFDDYVSLTSYTHHPSGRCSPFHSKLGLVLRFSAMYAFL